MTDSSSRPPGAVSDEVPPSQPRPQGESGPANRGSSLPPYSGEDVTCPKCRNKGASTRFLPYGRCSHGSETIVIGWEPNERLHRECTRCAHAWDEQAGKAAHEHMNVGVFIGTLDSYTASVLTFGPEHRQLPAGSKMLGFTPEGWQQFLELCARAGLNVTEDYPKDQP
ncbi:hypothetical protein ACFYOK_29490 [Microbispora bryophytorum]|uniref:hypothetical protein n=1 Tax=Microbispora bryophytorum TaxID=1460882 RepID=UPI0033D9246B